MTEAHADVATDTLILISTMILAIERFMAIFNIKPGKKAFSQPNDGAKSYIYEIAAKGHYGAIQHNPAEFVPFKVRIDTSNDW